MNQTLEKFNYDRSQIQTGTSGNFKTKELALVILGL